jgi:hypothetical protein
VISIYRDAPFGYRMVLIIALVLAVPAVELYYRYHQYSERLTRDNTVYSVEAHKLEELLSTYKDVRKVKGEIVFLEREIAVSGSRVDRQVDFGDLMMVIDESSRKSGVEFVKLEPLNQVERDRDGRDIIVDVTVNGGFDGIVEFFRLMLSKRTLYVFEAMKIESYLAQNDADYLVADQQEGSVARNLNATARVRLYRHL